MIAADPNFEQRSRDSFARQPVEYKINLLAPARGPLLHFEGEVGKAGRTIRVVDGRAFQFAPGGGERKLVATMTATIMTVTGRDDVRA